MLDKQTAAYALLAMYEIARRHRGVKNPPGVHVGDIVAKYKLPQAYVPKILSGLVDAELLDSVRGPKGGLRLNRPMNNITLYDIFKGAEVLAPLNTRRHQVKGVARPVATTINRVRQEFAASVKELLVGITLADLFKSK